MKYIYVCSPYGGTEENYFKAQNYCRYVIEKGNIPLCPVTMLHGIADCSEKSENVLLELQKKLFNVCDEVWVFGKSNGFELSGAASAGKSIVYVKDTFRFNNTSETLALMAREYESKTGRIMNRGIMESMLYYLNLGMSDKLIIAAIKKTALAGADWRYTEAILKSCYGKGITTAEELGRERAPEREKEIGASYDLDMYEKMLDSRD